MMFWANKSSLVIAPSWSGALCFCMRLECWRLWGCLASYVKLERTLGVSSPKMLAYNGETSLRFVLYGN